MEGFELKAHHWSKASIVFLLVMSVVLSACGNANKNEGGSSASPSGSASASPSESAKPAEIVQLKGITMGNEPASGMDNFYKELDALTIPDLGATFRFDFIPWGDEKNQISRAIASKEYDLYVGGAWSDFATFASKNAFWDMTPYLQANPALGEHYKGQLDYFKIDGKVYGIPQFGPAGGGGDGFLYREDLRQQWGLPEVKDLATVEQYLYKAKDEFKDTPMINDKRAIDNVFWMLAGSKYLRIDSGYTWVPISDPYKAVSLYDTPEYRQALDIVAKWYADGIIDHDVLAQQGNATSETLELMKAGKKPLEFNNHFSPVSFTYVGEILQAIPDTKLGWFDYVFKNAPNYEGVPSVNGTSSIQIGASSKHAVIAMKLIEKYHTDQTYYNLMQYGVKGENYQLDGAGYINYGGIPAENKKPGWTGGADGYRNLKTKFPGEWNDMYWKMQEEGAAIAVKTGPSPLAGFAFNNANVTGELGNMETVKSQYIEPLAVGITKNIDADLKKVQDALKKAGLDKYLAELQTQLDAFKASKS